MYMGIYYKRSIGLASTNFTTGVRFVNRVNWQNIYSKESWVMNSVLTRQRDLIVYENKDALELKLSPKQLSFMCMLDNYARSFM